MLVEDSSLPGRTGEIVVKPLTPSPGPSRRLAMETGVSAASPARGGVLTPASPRVADARSSETRVLTEFERRRELSEVLFCVLICFLGTAICIVVYLLLLPYGFASPLAIFPSSCDRVRVYAFPGIQSAHVSKSHPTKLCFTCAHILITYSQYVHHRSAWFECHVPNYISLL